MVKIKSQDPGRLCDAMEAAGITNPNSQEGIDFCIDKCPYPLCDIYDTSRGRPTSNSYTALSKREAIIAMDSSGIGLMDIALTTGISIRTVERTLKNARMDKSDKASR